LSETVTAYTFVRRDNYLTTDLLPGNPTGCLVGFEAVGTREFRAWIGLLEFATFMVMRCPHARGGYWPNKLEAGFRPIQLEFTWPDDGGIESDPGHPHGPPDFGQLSLTRADVIAELDPEDVYAVVPPRNQDVNYQHARNSMQELFTHEGWAAPGGRGRVENHSAGP
jgi:hypothetical protein